MSYVNVFTGEIVQPAQASYAVISVPGATEVHLSWPSLSTTTDDVLALINDIGSSVGGTIFLPAANEASVGQDAFFNFVGSGLAEIKDFDGNSITTIINGETKYFYLTDNTTTAGEWRVFTFGTGTSGADAVLLAGKGLKALSNKLVSNYGTPEVDTDQLITVGSRAQIYQWIGGVGTFTLDSVATVGDGNWWGVRNDGTGAITVVPDGTDTIDGNPSTTLNPGDSCFFVAQVASSGPTSTWLQIGIGRLALFTFSNLVIDTTPGDLIPVSSTAAQAKIILLTGVPASPTSVNLPAVPSVYWFNNQSSGASPVFIGVDGVVNFGIEIASGQHLEVVCTGSGLHVATDFTIGTFLFAFGSEAAPSITFASDTTLGFYHDATDPILRFTPDGLTSPVSFNVDSSGAALDLVSTTQGLGLPSLTTTERDAIATPRDGLFIFNSTTGKINLYSSGWLDPTFPPAANLVEALLITPAAVTPGSTSTIVFDSVAVDTLGIYSFSTGIMTPNIPGWWLINVSLSLVAAGASLGDGVAEISFNAGADTRGAQLQFDVAAQATNPRSLTFSGMFLFNGTTDNARVQLTNNFGAVNLTALGNFVQSNFSAVFLGNT